MSVSSSNIFGSIGSSVASQFSSNCGNIGELSKYIDVSKLIQTIQNGGSMESALEEMGLELSQLPMDIIQKLLSEVMSMLGGAGNYTQEATQEVDNNNTTIRNTSKDIDLTRRTGNEKIDAVLENIEKNVKNIEGSISKLQELKKEAEEELQNYKKEIEESQKNTLKQVEILNSKDSTTEQKRNALREISSINTTIADKADSISTMLASYSSKIETESNIVAQATTEIASENEKAVTEIENTTKEIAQETQTGVTEGGQIVSKTGADGVKDISMGTLAEVAGTGCDCTGVGAVVGERLNESGAEKIAAGTIKTAGLGEGLVEIGKVLQTGGTAYADVANQATILGEANSVAADRITAFGSLSATFATSTITSIGTISTNLTTEVENVKENIEEYEQYLDNQDKLYQPNKDKYSQYTGSQNKSSEKDSKQDSTTQNVPYRDAKNFSQVNLWEAPKFKNPEYQNW